MSETKDWTLQQQSGWIDIVEQGEDVAHVYGLDGVPNSRGVWQRDRGQYDREEEVFGPCAAAAAYRREMLADVARAGGTEPAGMVLDPQLWMYCEDVDLNLRARLRGHRTRTLGVARRRPELGVGHRMFRRRVAATNEH